MKMQDDDFNESEMFGDTASPAPPVATPTGGNPLAGYFRVPGLSIGLPTGGRYLPEGAIELDVMNQVSVYPMRGADELLLKSPDALMSGLAIEKLIQSCVPAIKTPMLISSPDLDVLLLAIRAATYGNMMTIELDCPECEHEMEFDCDLNGVLATLTPVPESLDLRLSSEIVVHMRPHTLQSQTKLLIAAYEEQRHAMVADEVEDEQERHQLLRNTLDKIKQFQYSSVADAITKISVPNAEVTDRQHIHEYVVNAPRKESEALLKRVGEINEMGIDRTLAVECEKCKHAWKSKIEFNPSTFFGRGSSV